MKILIGGSPCTYWSICRAGNTQTEITRETVAEGIGWELFENYLIAKEKFRPDIYLYENVKSMSNDIKAQISAHLGVESDLIKGGLFSAAERDRLFWSNILLFGEPQDKGLVLRDILESDVDEKYYYSCEHTFHGWDKAVCATLHINGNDILKRVSNPAFKCPTLTTCGGGNTQKKVLINGRVRKLTPTEYERCMTLPDGYTKAVCDSQRYNGCGNGWCADAVIWQLEQALQLHNVSKDEEIVVLSMYDGIGTGRYCFDKMGFTNVTYHASEIDKYAIQVAMSNYPDIIQHGDAFQVRDDKWRPI